MRTALMACLLVFSASVAYADTQPNRGAPYSGFSDEFYYSGGRMTGGQSVYKNEDPVLGRKDRERFKDSYNPSAECEYPYSCEHDGEPPRKYGRSDGELTYNNVYGNSIGNHGSNNDVRWKVKRPYVPSGTGFLSPCQAQVQDAINQKTLRNDEIYFSGSPTRGQAVDGQKQRYNYNCQNGDVYIW